MGIEDRAKPPRTTPGSDRPFGATALVLLLLGAGCAQSATPTPPRALAAAPAQQVAARTRTLTLSIVGINDVHGQLERLPLLGGYVNNLRRTRQADGGDVLLLDAGDVFQGSLASNLGEGAAMVAAYNALGVSAAALGNHEFDFGPAGPVEAPDRASKLDPQGALKERLREAHFPWLSANLRAESSGQLPNWQNLAASTLLTLPSGIRVGVVGGITEMTPKIVFPGWFDGLQVAPLGAALRAEAQRLRAAGAALIVVVAHAGAKCQHVDDPQNLESCDDGEIFRAVRELPYGLVDVVVAGHTHEGVAHLVNGVAVVEAYLKLKAFSRVDVTLELTSEGTPVSVKRGAVRIFPPELLCSSDKGTEAAACENTRYSGATVVPDKNVAQAIAPALLASERERQRLLGVDLPRDLEPHHDKESELGNFTAELMLLAAPAPSDLALLNSGSLRAPLAAGPLTFGAMYANQPFDNRLVRLRIRAGTLKAALLRNLEADEPGIVCFAGIQVTLTCRAGVSSIALQRRDGRAIADDVALTVVTSDYLANGGDGLLAADHLLEPLQDLGVFFRDALIGALQSQRAALPKLAAISAKSRLHLPMPRPVRCPK